MPHPAFPVLFLAFLSGCRVATPSSPSPLRGNRAGPVVEHWGAMREVLREGKTEGRVVLAEVLGPQSIAVGASAGLAAEITVLAGTARLAQVLDPQSPRGLLVRAPLSGEQATLLIHAEVAAWSEHVLPAVSDLAELETLVRETAEATGIDVEQPFPFRVEGVSRALHLHVLNHSCPIAAPDGPQPWRFVGADEPTVLVGFHAEAGGGVLTHHGQSTHTHAFVTERDVSGHLDEVSFAPGARLYLPGEPATADSR